jgi:G3E family GTPase
MPLRPNVVLHHVVVVVEADAAVDQAVHQLAALAQSQLYAAQMFCLA